MADRTIYKICQVTSTRQFCVKEQWRDGGAWHQFSPWFDTEADAERYIDKKIAMDDTPCKPDRIYP